MVSTMLAYILILGMLLIGQAAPKKRGSTDDDLVQPLNQRRDHKAWEMFRDDLMTSALPGDLISQAIAVMDAAHQKGTLLGAPGNSAGSGASNINAEPDNTNSDTPAGGEPSHAEGTPILPLGLFSSHRRIEQLSCNNLRMMTTLCRSKLHSGVLSSALRKADLQKHGRRCSD